MGRPPSIPPELEAPVLGKLGERWSYQRVAEWLLAEHKVKTSHQSVKRLAERVAEERSTVTRAQTVDRLSRTVTSDLDAFDADERDLKDIAAGLAQGLKADDRSELTECIGKVPRVTVYLGVVDRLHRIRELRLKYSGAGGKGGGETAAGPAPVAVIPAEDPDA